MQNIKFIFGTLQQLLTLKRFLLLVLLGAFVGLLMTRALPLGPPVYAGVLYGLIGLLCAKLAFWLSPLKKRRN